MVGLKTKAGVMIKEPEAQAELLNEFYDSVFRPANGQPIPTPPIPWVMMGIPVFTPCLAHQELSPLNTSNNPGQLQPLTDLFNKSLTAVVMPGVWEAAVVCPIFKKGEKEDVANYHLVNLTSVMCKVFERISKRIILSFLRECNAITGCQLGFLPR